MEKLTKPKKTLEQLAMESWLDIEPILLEDMKMKMILYQVGYANGYRKRGEDIVCTKSGKK